MSGECQLYQQLNVPLEALLWIDPSYPLDPAPERILLFESAGGRPLTLVSNFPYEVWLDNQFIGDGGHRCAPGEALADHWEEATHAQHIQVRLHWLDLEQTPVLYRCLFPDPFFAEIPPGPAWTCSIESSIRFAAKASAQLPRQTIVVKQGTAHSLLPLTSATLRSDWKIINSPIARARYVPVEIKLTSSYTLTSLRQESFQPERSENVALYVRDHRPCELICDTYDLGQIALHRFEVYPGSHPCVLYFSEVSDFEKVADTRYRAKVHLADAVCTDSQLASLFGTRGCRYVHLIYPPTSSPKPQLKAWRREYPLRWKSIQVGTSESPIIEACKVNLVACIDGGAVDTCWRERAQWTGDLRMSSLALRALADNPEVTKLALHQIAQSYNSKTGLVSGAWPILNPDAELPIPTFHLAFCM